MKEIERKFLVINSDWRADSQHSIFYCQGYLPTQEGCTVRVRLAGERAYLTIKGKPVGLSRDEYEYDIPLADGQELLATLCRQPLIQKIRHHVFYKGYLWQVDEFTAEHRGLLLAEIELEEAAQEVPLPPWLGQEVSHDYRYSNAYLAQFPKSWQRES